MQGSVQTPWEVHPELTAERLRVVGGVIRQVRDQAVALHDPESGDSPWSLGCRAYSRTCHGIRRASEQPDHRAWLKVVDQTGLHFVFSVGGVPLRFYKTEDASEEVAPRTLRRFFPEIQAQQLAFFSAPDVPATDLFLRLAVETEDDGRVARITFLQLDGVGTIYLAWPIPLDDAGDEPLSTRRGGVTLPPPPIGPARSANIGEATTL